MALTHDCIYYLPFKLGGKIYQLEFIPGNENNLTAPFAYKRFQSDVTISEITVSNAYDKELPLGLPLAATMKFKLDLTALIDRSTDDWSVIRQLIVNGTSANTRTVNGVATNIPNRWRLRHNNFGESGYSTMVHTVFDGFQDKRPEYKITIDKSGKVEFEIECVDIMRTVYSNVTIEQWAAAVTGTAYNSSFYHLNYNNAGVTDYLIYVITAGYSYEYESLYDIFNALTGLARNVFTAFTRGEVTSADWSGNPSNTLTCYQQVSNDKYHSKGTALSNDLIQVVTDVIFNSVSQGGIFCTAANDKILPEFTNAWDVLKSLCENWCNKVYVNYRNDMSKIYYKFTTPYDQIYTYNRTAKTNSTTTLTVSTEGLTVGMQIVAVITTAIPLGTTIVSINTVDELTMSAPATTSGSLGVMFIMPITASKIIGDLNITIGKEFIVKGISHLKGVIDDNSGENVNVKDLTEIEYKDNSGTLNEKAYETEHIFHNQIPGSNSILGTPWVGPYTSITRYVQRCIDRGLYYLNTDLYAISDYIQINLGDSVTISPESSYNSAELIQTILNVNDNNTWINNRMQLSGIGYVAAKAYMTLLGNRNQALIEVEVDVDTVDPTFLGATYTLDLDDFVKGDYLTPPLKTKAILTNIETDYKSGKSKIKLFLRGD